ncbi:MAG: PQQ-binding-like beta-propeller repeat protein [Planctomycetaceae bacterium]
MPLSTRRLLTACTVLVVSSTAAANDWAQWRGPGRTGVSAETGLMQEWPEGGPERVWLSRGVGLGYSGMAVVGDTLYTMGAIEGQEHVIAVNVEDGSTKWSTAVGDVLDNGWGGGPRSTPTVDGEFVYGLSGKGIAVCLKAANGELVWKKDFVSELGGKIPNWGYTESLLVDGDKLVGTPGGREGTVAAFNKATGELLWRSTEFTEPAAYSSIIAVDHAGQRQFIQLTQAVLAGIDANNGQTVWSTPWDGKTAVIPTPIYNDGYVYISSGYGVGCKLVKVDANNQVEQIYKNQEMKNHHGGVVRVGDALYGYSDGQGWLCQDFLTGESVWNEKNELKKGALTCADGRLYLQSEDEGKIVLIEVTRDGWKQHGSFTLEPQTEQRSPKGRIWTHPTVANGKLYLRDQELLFCFDIEAK